ncbi:hypothetical protein FNV43_RR16739 [Rhamnella rubrinervis]|uniref:Uncharacterized protein n=1 Tax=Rhamnella rubrinervis TaxID=2594499 RepID=A0A8K0MDQ7_9ROSA|nr:hypothetical protein FNV43_RR16739 [Rhamnella rubrinervis]
MLHKRSSRRVDEPIVEPSSKRLRTGIDLTSSSGVICQDIINVRLAFETELKRLKIDHCYEMYHWYMDQFRKDPGEQ